MSPPSPITTLITGTLKIDISLKFLAIASDWPRSSAPIPGYAPGVSIKQRMGILCFSASVLYSPASTSRASSSALRFVSASVCAFVNSLSYNFEELQFSVSGQNAWNTLNGGFTITYTAALCSNAAICGTVAAPSAALKPVALALAKAPVAGSDAHTLSSAGLAWTSVPIREEERLTTVTPLERLVSSPATPLDAVDRASRRVGGLLLDPLGPFNETAAASGQLLLEPDPLLGNLPWPPVATAAGPIGLRFNLEEEPSLLSFNS